MVAIVRVDTRHETAAAEQGQTEDRAEIAALADAPRRGRLGSNLVECEQASEAMVGDKILAIVIFVLLAVLVAVKRLATGSILDKPEAACWCSSSTSTT